MSAFRFRLESVLRLRRAEEGNARVRLLERNLELHNAISFRDQEIKRLSMMETPLGPIERDQLLSEHQSGALVATSIISAKEILNHALAEAANAQLAWTAAARAVEVLERLERKRRSEHDDREQRIDAIEIDDIVNAASNRRRSTIGSDA